MTELTYTQYSAMEMNTVLHLDCDFLIDWNRSLKRFDSRTGNVDISSKITIALLAPCMNEVPSTPGGSRNFLQSLGELTRYVLVELAWKRILGEWHARDCS